MSVLKKNKRPTRPRRRGLARGNNIGTYVLDDAGEPVREPDLITWVVWFETATKEGRKHIADDTVGPYRVSTVFLGLDHRFGGEGPPVLWETMIFGVPETFVFLGKRRRYRKELGQQRYRSKAEALAGHARAVKYAESLPQPVSAPDSVDPTPSESPPPAATN